MTTVQSTECSKDELPPHSTADEQALLGCCLLEPSLCLAPTIARLRGDPLAFYETRHQNLFLALVNMHREGGLIDTVSVQRRLLDTRRMEDVGGLDYISTLMDKHCPTAYNYQAYLEEVQDRWLRRQAYYDVDNYRDSICNPNIRIGTTLNVIASCTRMLTEELQQSKGIRQDLSLRSPEEIRGMDFDENDRILGDRLLANGQPLTILGAGGLGKSRLLLQLAACCITGREFLGLTTRGRHLKWLVIQAENSNRRLRFDLNNIKQWLGHDWQAVNDQLYIHTLENEEDGFLSLGQAENLIRLADLISKTKPDVVCLDPLNAFGIGDLNSDRDMRDTCQTISRLVKQGDPERSCIVLHHAITGKAGMAKATGYDRTGFGRNSKVLQAWTRGQINVAPGSPDNNDVLVLSCGKCSNGREFPSFAASLNPDTMIYELEPSFDLQSWANEIACNKPGQLISVETVIEHCKGAMAKKELVKAIMDETGCSRSLTYKKINEALLAKKLHRNPIDKTYVAA